MNANTINSKNVISGVNDLATKCPKISAMWSAKNTYTPSEVSVGSNKKAWFVCPDCKQEFEARVFHIARSLMRGNTGCPVCAGLKVVPGINDLATKCPKIFAMWSAKNTYTPSEASAGTDLPPGKPGRFWKRLHKKRYSDFSFQALSIGIARARTVNQAPHWEH